MGQVLSPMGAHSDSVSDDTAPVISECHPELRFKNQRAACHETKPLTPKFMVVG